MQRVEILLRKLGAQGDIPSLLETLRRQIADSPEWLEFEADIWNVAPIHRLGSVKTSNINFGDIVNLEIRDLARLHALWQIVDRKVGPASVRTTLSGFIVLDQVMGMRSINTLKTEDFYVAEGFLLEKFNRGSAARFCDALSAVGCWLTRQVGIRIHYPKGRIRKESRGRAANDEQRRSKLLPDEVIAALLACRQRESLDHRDRFFLSAIGISVATGFRLNELMTLPKDCLIEDAGALLVRNITSKRGKDAPRPVPEELADIVRDAVSHILAVTDAARQKADTLHDDPPLDWPSILSTDEPHVADYFVRRWLFDWIGRHFNRLVDPNFAFFATMRGVSRWIPMRALMEKHCHNVSAMATDLKISRQSIVKLVKQLELSQRGQVNFAYKNGMPNPSLSDPRLPTTTSFLLSIGHGSLGSASAKIVPSIMSEARAAMIAQSEFSCPEKDIDLETRYRRQRVVLRNTQTGNVVLYLRDALFVIFKDQLAPSGRSEREIPVPVTASSFSHWLTGYGRDRGTGKLTDAVCARFGIIDPRTGVAAKFTHHDFRHWLVTSYENGGLSQTQIATLFNRQSPIQCIVKPV